MIKPRFRIYFTVHISDGYKVIEIQSVHPDGMRYVVKTIPFEYES